MCFQVFGFLFCNCKQSARQLLSILYDAFLDEEIQLIDLLARSVREVLVKIFLQAQIQTNCISDGYNNLPCILNEIH